MKRIQREVEVMCRDCDGKGYGHNPNGTRKPCVPCKGTGNVKRLVNEIVHEDNEAHSL